MWFCQEKPGSWSDACISGQKYLLGVGQGDGEVSRKSDREKHQPKRLDEQGLAFLEGLVGSVPPGRGGGD